MGYLALTLALLLAAWICWRIGTARREEACEEAKRQSYRRRIAEDPDNAGAYEALGDSLQRAQRLEEARAAYQAAVAMDNGTNAQARTHYKLRQVEDTLSRPRGARPPRELWFCERCGGANAPTRRHCEQCHHTLPYDNLWDAFKDREVQRAGLESAAIILVIVVVLFVFRTLPLAIKGVLIISTTFVLGWRMLRAIEGKSLF